MKNACQYILIFSCLITFLFSSVWAASQFDSDDDMVFEADDSFDSDAMQFDSDDSFDSDDPIFEDNEFVSNDAALKAEKNTAPWYSNQLIDDSRFTFGYEFSHQLSIKPSYITHDIYLRQETQTLLRDNLYVKFDGRFNYYFDNDHRTKARQKSILTDTNLRELYLQFGFSKFNVTFGRQIVVWGKADTQIITDVVSPRDNSDFIFIKLEDSRLGQLMLSSDIYSDWGHFFVFISPNPLIDNEPDPGTAYDISIQGFDFFSSVNTMIPEEDLFLILDDKPSYADTEYGIQWKKNFGSIDLSLMAGYFFDNAGIYHCSGFDWEQLKIQLNKNYHPYEMIGLAASYATGACLLKVETAVKKRLSFQSIDVLNLDIGSVEKNIMDMGVGLEYNANGRYLVSGEISNRFVPGDTESLLFTDRHSTSVYTTFTKDFFHDTLTFEYMLYYHIQEENCFHQVRLSHDLTDNLKIISACAFFNINDKKSLLWFYRDADRLSCELRYYY